MAANSPFRSACRMVQDHCAVDRLVYSESGTVELRTASPHVPVLSEEDRQQNQITHITVVGMCQSIIGADFSENFAKGSLK
ncbi:MAG TPA: hypothetical protein VFZ27_01920 [Terriglobia bacterium]|nr:hypothetical protein [Terriglobia bacterium]